MTTPDVFLPLLFKVKIHSFNPDAVNDLGNKKEAWDEPVEEDVYGWGPPQLQEGPKEVLVGTSRYVVALELMVPPGVYAKDGDKVELDDGSMWRVVGPTEDYSHNPFGWNPGNVINLINVKGVK
ncbi:head-to-tail stopper [Mycobacterium phage JacoRen57]|nr:head-to-tail stopper [Mycobacterium phage JacoRen57]